ncbi:unnamed protein product [Blepharisma stoltei]|uniref:Kinesin motor domain-containing protein n=1 Tax=Blepharisma stoltei TaxID=1481888 RepID=A0AAU9JBN0_9CILI|nr:unnamed protein product [Blepharisma stoltei]
MSNKNLARSSYIRSQTSIVDSIDNVQGLSSRSNNIKVVGRFRPLVDFEKAFLNNREIISFINDKTVAIGEGKDKESFTLDRIYGPDSTNQEIFEFVGKQTILDVMDGYNGTIFVYGQTGSGKTYTMLGDDIYDEDSRGIIPRAAAQIFDSVQNNEEETEYILKCSMVEIYKETLRDLLDAEPKLLKIKESPRRGVYVEGLNEVCVTSEIEMLEILSLGETMRTVAATKLNKMSSRSHLIFILEVMQKYSNGSEKKGMLNLVDLAGSEKVHSTGVAGPKIEETKKINLSLSALGNVIHALISNSDHVPYRDSKLTRILQESLGGNYKTTLIVACSLSPKSEEETLNTMRFALRARAIRNKVRVNMRDAPENYIQKIEYLEAELRTAKTEIIQLKGENPRKSSPNVNKMMGRMSTISLDSTTSRKRRGSEMKTKENNGDIKVMVSLDELRQFSDEPSRIEKKSPNPFPLFEPDSLASSFNFIPEKGASDAEVDSTSNFRENLKQKDEEIQEAKKKNHSLKKENQALTDKVRDLEEKMASMRAKQLQTEQKTHEYYDNYHKTALLINKDAAENALLKKQNESLNNQVKRLTKALMELDRRYKNFIDSCRKFDVSTCVEFEERTETLRKDDFPVITEVNDVDVDTSDSYDLGLSRRDISIDRKDLLTSSPYAIELKKALDNNAELCKDVALFQLRNELIQAGIINANLVRAYHGLDWKLNLVNHKYMMKRSLCKHQMENIKSLEKMLDFLHHSYRHVIKLYDQMEREAPKTHCQTEQTPRTRMMRTFTNKKITRVINGQIVNTLPQDSGSFTFSGQALRSAARTLSVRPIKEIPTKTDEATPKHYNSSFAEAESIDPSFYHTKLRAIETSFNLQQLYNEQLKKMNEEYKEELNQYKLLVSNLEGDIFTSHKNEMERWKTFVDELKNNCEQELIRKQCEVVRLNEVLGEWTTRFMELQENLSTPNKPLKKEMYIEIQELVRSTMSTAIYTEPMTNINRMFGRSPLREYMNITPVPITRRLASQGDQTP